MTLIELMTERTPPHLAESATGQKATHHWWGWLTRQFEWMEDHSDWNRKV